MVPTVQATLMLYRLQRGMVVKSATARMFSLSIVPAIRFRRAQNSQDVVLVPRDDPPFNRSLPTLNLEFRI